MTLAGVLLIIAIVFGIGFAIRGPQRPASIFSLICLIGFFVFFISAVVVSKERPAEVSDVSTIP